MIMIFQLSAVYASRTELTVNGGFESYFDGWQPYVYDEIFGKANVTSGVSHSGSWCLRTYADPARESPYTSKRGGGVIQTLPTNFKDLDLTLSLWVMSAIVGENSYTTIRSVINMELIDGRSVNFSYYVAWAPSALGEHLYNTSDNTIFFLPASLHQWSYIQREVKKDFESKFGSSSGIVVSKLSVSSELTTLSQLTTPDAFWDDISVVAETQPPTTPTPPNSSSPSSPQPTSTSPTQSPTTSPSATSSTTTPPKEKKSRQNFIEEFTLPILIVILIFGLALIILTKRSRTRLRAKLEKKYCVNCGKEIPKESDYCGRCGAKQ